MVGRRKRLAGRRGEFEVGFQEGVEKWLADLEHCKRLVSQSGVDPKGVLSAAVAFKHSILKAQGDVLVGRVK